MFTATQVVELLQRHSGKDQGLRSREIVEILTGKRSTAHQERQLRKIVEVLRLEGFPICATPEDGYWWAESVEEIERVCNWHRARSLHSLKIAGRLRKYGVPLLSGQMILPISEAMPKIPEEVGVVDFTKGVEIGTVTHLPEEVYEALQDFLSRRPGWDKDRAITAALSLFLMQEGIADLSALFEAVVNGSESE